MWTKRQIINEAFGELALSGRDFDLSAEELHAALRRLDTMMATWRSRGVRVGYAFPGEADGSNLDDASGLPDAAVETTYLNLAIRLAPGYGKQLSPDTRRTAREGYDALLLIAAQPIQQQLPSTLPRGSGNKPYGFNRPFFSAPSDAQLQSSDPGALDILGTS